MKVLVAMLAFSTTVAAGSAVYLSATRAKLAPIPQASAVVRPVVAAAETGSMPSPGSSEHAEFVGRLAAAAEFEVRAAGSGSVLRARVDPGDLVEKGQTLIELENPTLDDSVRQAEMTLEQAKSELENEHLRQASGEQHRFGLLGGTPGGRGPGGGLGGRFGRNNELQARARVAEAEAALSRARRALGNSQIVSPVTGYVAERRVSAGDRIMPGMTVLRITDVSVLKLALDLPDGDACLAFPADARTAIMTFDAVPNRQFSGRVIHSLSGDLLAGHCGGVSIEVANPERILKPGMSARVRLVSDPYGEVASTSGRLARRDSRGPAETASDADLIREMVASLKGLAITLTVAADVQTKELTRKQEAAKVAVEATTQYFGLLERELVDLRPENTGHHAVSLDKAADQMDNFPILHVDEELLAFGAEVAQSLRAMAERRRSISRSRNADVTLSDEAQVENSAIRTEGMQRIQIGLASMRRKLTKKYNLEFVATAAPIHTASASTRRRTTRR
jgi:multidrug efflux pump subunit AcrA (membrane-fusion protein)